MKLKILNVEGATGQSGNKYYKVSTNRGEMTAFDSPIVDELMCAWRDKKEVNLNVVPSKDGRYQNIRGFAMDDDEGEEIDRTQMKPVKPQEFGKSDIPPYFPKSLRKPVKNTAYEKDPVGLAVEVFNALLEKQTVSLNTQQQIDNMMINAIALVKQAQKGFR